MIRTYIREGNIVPMEVTVKLLENAMNAALDKKMAGEGWANGKGRFLIDGFPRKMDQALKFDEEVCQMDLQAPSTDWVVLRGLFVFRSDFLYHDWESATRALT